MQIHLKSPSCFQDVPTLHCLTQWNFIEKGEKKDTLLYTLRAGSTHFKL